MLKNWLHSDSFWKRSAAVWVHMIAATLAVNTVLLAALVAFAVLQ